VVGYRVYRSTTSGFTPPGAGTLVGTSATNSFIDNSVPAGTHYYKIIAYDQAGNLSTASAQRSVTVAAVSSRFYGDPGVGKVYLGGSLDRSTYNNTNGAIDAWNARLRKPLATTSTNEGNGTPGPKRFAPVTTYNIGVADSTTRHIGLVRSFSSSSEGLDVTEVNDIINKGGIPHVSWKFNIQNVSTGEALGRLASGEYDSLISQWAQRIKNVAPVPVFWTFRHEPENDTGFGPETAAATRRVNCYNYRNANRRIALRFRDVHNVTNAAFFPVCYMTKFTWQSNSGGRQPWIYWPDLIGDPDGPWSGGVDESWNPSPSQIYSGTDRVAAGFGHDVYGAWGQGSEGLATYKSAFSDAFMKFYNRAVNVYPEGVPPTLVGETYWAAYATDTTLNQVVNANGDYVPTTNYSPQNTLTHNYVPAETVAMMRSLHNASGGFFADHNIIGLSFFNSGNATYPEAYGWGRTEYRLSWFDRVNARYQAWAEWADLSRTATWTDGSVHYGDT
jgi:hypothetical protein